ncbi:putative Ubiquitin-conjugating enzyme E2 R1 protein [Naja naja]|nr:putative Ubiquitin-conjugating enzyme E2 R1 protein [Naja naja]
MARLSVPSSQKALLLELKGLQEEPVEGFRVSLVDEGDLYNWEVAIFGPPNTHYEGGYFKWARSKRQKPGRFKKKDQRGGKKPAEENRLEISVGTLPAWDTCLPPGSHLSIGENRGTFFPSRHVPGDRRYKSLSLEVNKAPQSWLGSC